MGARARSRARRAYAGTRRDRSDLVWALLGSQEREPSLSWRDAPHQGAIAPFRPAWRDAGFDFPRASRITARGTARGRRARWEHRTVRAPDVQAQEAPMRTVLRGASFALAGMVLPAIAAAEAERPLTDYVVIGAPGVARAPSAEAAAAA